MKPNVTCLFYCVQTGTIGFVTTKTEKKVIVPQHSKVSRNDVDRRLPFFCPDGVTVDGKIYMVRSALQIKEAAMQSDNAEFRAFADRLKEDDNDILIFAELKK